MLAFSAISSADWCIEFNGRHLAVKIGKLFEKASTFPSGCLMWHRLNHWSSKLLPLVSYFSLWTPVEVPLFRRCALLDFLFCIQDMMNNACVL